MEVRILVEFHDRDDFTKVYPVGETFNFDDERAEHLIGLGLVEPVEEPAAEEAEAPAEEAEAPAEEPAAVAETEPIEEAAAKPAAAKKKSASKDN